MSEMKRPSLGDDEANSEPANARDSEQHGSAEIARDPNENHINGSFHENELNQELQERVRETDGRRSLMSGMPSINLSELTLILRDPRMPSHKVMNKVADRIARIGEDSESDDGSMGSTGGFVGFQGVMNCIFDAAFQIVQPGNSDDEDEDLERVPLKYSCKVCNKVFGNNMDSNTHVLVAHQDPSVLNLSRNADSKDKTHAHRRRHSKTLPRSEAVTTRGQPSRTLKVESKDTVRSSRGGEGAPSDENRSSESRSRHSEPHDKPRSSRDRVGAASLPTEQIRESETFSCSSSEPSKSVDSNDSTLQATSIKDSTSFSQDLPVTVGQHKPVEFSRDLGELSQDLPVADGGCELPDGASQGVTTQSPLSFPIDYSSGKTDARVESSAGGRVESPAGGRAEDRAESPAGGRVESPAEGRAESPAEDRAESPAGGRVELPAEGRTESPAEDRAESPVGGRAESPAGGRVESPAGGKAEPAAEGRVESPAGGRTESQKSEQNPRIGGRDQAPSTRDNNPEDPSKNAAPLSEKCDTDGDAIKGRKRSAPSPLPEPAPSSSSFNPKRPRKHDSSESDSDTPKKHDVQRI